LNKLEAFAARRREIVDRYNAMLADLLWLTRPLEADGVVSCFHLYVVQIDFAAIGKSRAEAMHELAELGIGSQVHYIPVHTQPWYRTSYGYEPGDCPVAEAYYERCLSLPLYPAMRDSDIERVVEAVRGLRS
jgi:dTDP-4-amino-4,6-dideoxygalactose transaminase